MKQTDFEKFLRFVRSGEYNISGCDAADIFTSVKTPTGEDVQWYAVVNPDYDPEPLECTKLVHTGDAQVWAKEFVKYKNKCGWTLDDIDEGLMIGWFANAMCAAEFREGRDNADEYTVVTADDETVCIPPCSLQSGRQQMWRPK